VSRTAKCRRLDNHPAAASRNCAVLSDAPLLLELRRLCSQPLDATYKRKLEAVVLLLQRSDDREIEDCTQASLRTVQRWARRARLLGPTALRCRARNRPTSKLSDDSKAHMAGDLKLAPESFGYTQGNWSAALLMRHIRSNYGVAFSLRHCRRLLAGSGVTENRVAVPRTERHGLAASAPSPPQELVASRQLGDYARKRQALARIKRLANSGMPLQPFAYTLFDLVRDGVPYDEISPGLAAASRESSRWIVRDFDFERWFPHMQRYLVDAGPEVSGFRPPSLLPQNPRTVLCHEEIVCPGYYRSEGYNEFFRSMGMHHGMLTLLRDDHGHFLGYYPMFRSEKMRPFSRDDRAFLEVVGGGHSAGSLQCHSGDFPTGR
jgi:transposase